MRCLRGLAMLLAAAVAIPLGAAEPLPAPGNLLAVAECEALDVSWEGVPGASAYAVEVTLVYDSAGDDCAAGSGATYVLRFSLETTNVSIDAASLVFNFGSGLRAPCRVPLVRVRALAGPGEPDNPAQSVAPLPGCSSAPSRPPSPRA